jgi:hypothetical protein
MIPDHVVFYEPGSLRVCTDCKSPKPIEEYRWINRKDRIPRKNGKTGRVTRCRIKRCRSCVCIRDNEKLAAKQARWMLKNYRKRDRKQGFVPTDLDYKTVEELISKPCFYCGETEITMTLDRIDNSLGHVRSNVNPACFRCNVFRGAMPYEAWILISKGMREARERGLFGTFIGKGQGRLRKRPGKPVI